MTVKFNSKDYIKGPMLNFTIFVVFVFTSISSIYGYKRAASISIKEKLILYRQSVQKRNAIVS